MMLSRGRRPRRRGSAPGLLEIGLPLAVGLELTDRKLGGPGIIEEVKRGNARVLIDRVGPYALTGYDNITGKWDPWGAVKAFYLPATLTSVGLKFVKRKFTKNRGFRAFGIKFL